VEGKREGSLMTLGAGMYGQLGTCSLAGVQEG
jgi:hypothetical protein